MGRVSKELTDRAVRNLGPGYHAIGKSLYIQVTGNGSRSWILRTLVQGKRREMGLGSYPDVSLAEVRDEAAKYRKIARKGGDPFVERDKGKVIVPSFEQAASTVHAEHSPGWRNEKHAAQWLSTLKQYAFPMFGSLPVSQVDTLHVKEALLPIWVKKPETARRVRQRIGLVLDWAKAHKHRSGDNPVETIADILPKQPDSDRHHTALPYADVPQFIAELREASTSEVVKLCFEFLILTAARTGEVLGATWAEVDLDKAEWLIPANRMKARREHRVPLSSRCIEILKRAREIGGKSYVFPTPETDTPLSNMALLMVLRRMGRKITAHGFRSTFRDWAAERTNFPREVCEQALAHTIKDKAEAAYRRSDLFEKRRELMATWTEFGTQHNAKIIPITAKRA